MQMHSIHINNNQQLEVSEHVDKDENVAEVAVNIVKEVKKLPECKISEGISEALIALNEVMKSKEGSDSGRRFSCKNGDVKKEGELFILRRI